DSAACAVPVLTRTARTAEATRAMRRRGFINSSVDTRSTGQQECPATSHGGARARARARFQRGVDDLDPGPGLKRRTFHRQEVTLSPPDDALRRSNLFLRKAGRSIPLAFRLSIEDVSDGGLRDAWTVPVEFSRSRPRFPERRVAPSPARRIAPIDRGSNDPP